MESYFLFFIHAISSQITVLAISPKPLPRFVASYSYYSRSHPPDSSPRHTATSLFFTVLHRRLRVSLLQSSTQLLFQLVCAFLSFFLFFIVVTAPFLAWRRYFGFIIHLNFSSLYLSLFLQCLSLFVV